MSANLPCPSAETLAAYLDGKLPAAERAAVEKHLADCEDCFEQVAAAAAFQAEEAERGVLTQLPRVRRQPARWVAVAAALATVAVGVWLTRGRPDLVSRSPDALAWAGQLGSADELEAASARAWTDEAGGFGFGSGLAPAKRAFRLGVHLLDARVAFEAGETERLSAALQRASALLPGEPRANEIAASLRAGVDASEVSSMREMVDGLAITGRALDPAAFDLGAWVETGRLAALGGNTKVLESEFATAANRGTSSTLSDDPAAARELAAIRAALADRRVSAQELGDLERSFQQLLLLN